MSRNTVGFAIAFLVFVSVGCDSPSDQPSEPQAPSVCGTIQGLTCSDNQYCDFGTGQCKIADAAGVCKDKPDFCTREFRPVCGCDGRTYGNSCEAAGAGVSIDHPGECETASPQGCGGIAAFPCPEGQICADDPNDNCDPDEGGADCPGICKDKPQEPQSCGGIAGIPCPEGKTCVDNPDDDCDPADGGADCPGICKEQ